MLQGEQEQAMAVAESSLSAAVVRDLELKRRMELFLSPSAVSTEVASEVGNTLSSGGRSRRVHTFDTSECSKNKKNN